MIGPSGNVRVYLACGVTDMRRRIDGLSALAESVIKEAPGQAPSSDSAASARIGSSFYGGMAERGYFPWPTAKDGVAHLTQAQLSMLVEGIDWRRPAWTSAPGRTG
ncbi:IS66 family insertion sequence element accessory protein TnpB [Sinorhizobium psoraleae]|uniref:IS66 family insertion sequence element accessory protein TnpB n=1 Tax=Sinorhizobium psoraleae TaxID=520838 RepID=UPI0035E3C2ED